MSKKRLEEIEKRYSELAIIRTENKKEYVEIEVDDLVFLIQNNFKQAEQVEEYKLELQNIQDINKENFNKIEELRKTVRFLRAELSACKKINRILTEPDPGLENIRLEVSE